MNNDYQQERQLMLEHDIRGRGIMDPHVLDAVMNVPRHLFVPKFERSSSYSDGPLPIGHGQTISQPYMVALMTELLELDGSEKVLELGTGSGYQTAVLAEIVREVYTVEIIEELGSAARHLLTETLHYTNIRFRLANGREGWAEEAPFDRIMLTAAPPSFPEQLFDQLGEGGSIIAPVGDYFQRLIKYRKKDGKIKSESLMGVSFVPFV